MNDQPVHLTMHCNNFISYRTLSVIVSNNHSCLDKDCGSGDMIVASILSSVYQNMTYFTKTIFFLHMHQISILNNSPLVWKYNVKVTAVQLTNVEVKSDDRTSLRKFIQIAATLLQLSQHFTKPWPLSPFYKKSLNTKSILSHITDTVLCKLVRGRSLFNLCDLFFHLFVLFTFKCIFCNQRNANKYIYINSNLVTNVTNPVVGL